MVATVNSKTYQGAKREKRVGKREESRQKPIQNVHGRETPGCWASARRKGYSHGCRHQCAGLCQTNGINTYWCVPNKQIKKRSGLSFPRRCTSPQAHAAAFVQAHNAPSQRGHPVMAHTDRRTEPAADTLRDGSRQSARRAPSRARPRWPTPATAPPTPTKHAMVADVRRRKKKEVKKRKAGCVRGKAGETQGPRRHGHRAPVGCEGDGPGCRVPMRTSQPRRRNVGGDRQAKGSVATIG